MTSTIETLSNKICWASLTTTISLSMLASAAKVSEFGSAILHAFHSPFAAGLLIGGAIVVGLCLCTLHELFKDFRFYR